MDREERNDGEELGKAGGAIHGGPPRRTVSQVIAAQAVATIRTSVTKEPLT